jgi:hypothetical protein
LAFDSTFNAEVSTNYSVIKFAPNTTRTSLPAATRTALCASASLDATFQANTANNPSLKWQNFASRHGFIRSYPGRLWDATSQFDARLRPWFTAAAAGPRDVVVLVDASSSVGRQGRLGLVRDAAERVLRGLSDQDAVAVFFFNETVAPTVYNRTMVRATTDRVGLLLDAVHNRAEPPGGLTNVESALLVAYETLHAHMASGRSPGCSRSVVLITDGQPTDGDLYSAAATTALSSISAHLFVFAVGQDVSPAMQDAACASRGFWLRVPERSQSLVDVTMQYYMRLADMVNQTGRVWRTNPYTDAGGLGLVMTLSTAVYGPDRYGSFCRACIGLSLCLLSRSFVGVVAIDVSVDELVAATGFPLSAFSYAFVSTSNGQILYHPQLTSGALRGITTDYLNFLFYERAIYTPSDADAIFAGIRNMTAGTRAGVQLIRPTLAGDADTEGNNRAYLVADYAWVPIPSHGLVMCFCLSQGDASVSEYDPDQVAWSQIRAQMAVRFPSFAAADYRLLYHDLERVPDELVSKSGIRVPSEGFHAGIRIANSSTVFKVAPLGFLEPFDYVQFETATDVRRLSYNANQLPLGETIPASRLNTLALQDVSLTAYLDPLFQAAFSNPALRFFNQTVFMYVGTARGVYRQFPGSLVADRSFDPREQPWYTRAEAFFASFAISPPFTSTNSRAGTVRARERGVISRALMSGSVFAGCEYQSHRLIPNAECPRRHCTRTHHLSQWSPLAYPVALLGNGHHV